MKEIIENVIQALNKGDTHGENSLNYLLASIQTLRELLKTITEASRNENQDE